MDRAKKIIDIYKNYGDKDYIGEDMTQIQHALQCAYFAKKTGCDNDTIIASLLHDIGHLLFFDRNNIELMDGYGIKSHEKFGADFLKKLDPEAVEII